MEFARLSSALIMLLVCGFTAEGKAHEKDAFLYRKKLDEVNQFLTYLDSTDYESCPVSPLVLSCGDTLCDPSLENVDNCPADCVSTPVKSYNHQISCADVFEYVVPQSMPELQSAIKWAAHAGMQVRVVGNRHSMNEQYCTNGMAISLANFNRILGIERDRNGEEVVVVESSVTMEQLANWLHKRKRSLGYAQLGFRNATIAGAIATGAHGSSPKHTAVISSLVRGVTLVTAAGEIMEVSDLNLDALRGVSAHLGLLGVVTTIKLKIEKQFRLEVRVSYHNDSLLLAKKGLHKVIKDCDYALINWFPSLNKFVKTCGKKTKKGVDEDAENILLQTGIPEGLISPFKLALHYGMCYPAINAGLEELRYLWLKWLPPFQKRSASGQIGHTRKAVGYSHKMISSAFTEPADHFFQNDWEFAIPMSEDFSVLKTMHEHLTQNHYHFPLIGVFLRFVPSEDFSLLAHTTSVGEFKKNTTVVLFEFPTPAAIGFSKEDQARIDGPYEEIARLLVAKFNARPHWGKNRDWVFKSVLEQGAYGDNLNQFKELRKSLDPNGMFVNDFAHRVGLVD